VARYLNPLDRHGLKGRLVLVQRGEAVRWHLWTLLRPLEVGLDVKVRIAVLDVQAPALLDNLLDLSCAGVDCLLVGLERILPGDAAFWGIGGSAFGVEIVGQDGEDLAGMFGGELVPELVDASLRGLFLHCDAWVLLGSLDGHAGSS